MAKEARLWDWLSNAKIFFKSDLHMHRIENTASPGMPDVEGYHVNNSQFWFELKSELRPADPKTPIRFETRPKQVEWHRRRWNLGGACYWLLQVGHASDRRIYMLEGIEGEEIHKGLTEAELLARTLVPVGSSPHEYILAANR